MINCYNCYRCKHIQNKLYCPFFGLNPCIRGEHEIVIPEKPQPKPKARVLKFPPSKSRCVPYGVFIMKSLKKGMGYYRIAYLIGIDEEKIHNYVEKILQYNCINERMLKFYDIE